MAWYQINYACGHTGREQIYGKVQDRQNKANWLGNNKVCKSCQIKSRAAADKAAVLKRAGLKAIKENNF